MNQSVGLLKNLAVRATIGGAVGFLNAFGSALGLPGITVVSRFDIAAQSTFEFF